MIYIVDIETEADKSLLDMYTAGIKAPKNYVDKEKIEAYKAEKALAAISEMALDQDYSSIRCVGVKVLGESGRIVSVSDLCSMLNKDNNFSLVTFNGKRFDLPILIKHCIKYDIDAPFRQLMYACKRFNTENHTDLMELCSFGEQAKSLDTYCKIYLRKEKHKIDFSTCTEKQLHDYCIMDLELTEQLYYKFVR